MHSIQFATLVDFPASPPEIATLEQMVAACVGCPQTMHDCPSLMESRSFVHTTRAGQRDALADGEAQPSVAESLGLPQSMCGSVNSSSDTAECYQIRSDDEGDSIASSKLRVSYAFARASGHSPPPVLPGCPGSPSDDRQLDSEQVPSMGPLKVTPSDSRRDASPLIVETLPTATG